MEKFLIAIIVANTVFNIFVMLDTRRVEKVADEAKRKADFCMYVISKKYTEKK